MSTTQSGRSSAELTGQPEDLEGNLGISSCGCFVLFHLGGSDS